MAKINFTYALKRFFPTLGQVETDGANVREIVEALDQTFPGIRAYIVDDQGRLREHVNIFLNNTLIQDRTTLSDTVSSADEIFIMQALSGG